MRPRKKLAILGVALLSASGGALGVDTTIGVRGIPSASSLLRDVNGDGLVTDSDIVIQLLTSLGQGPEPDVDGDGHVTSADTLRAVERLIAASCADVNESSEVDESDLMDECLAYAASDQSPVYDVNGDGAVDALDVVSVMEAAQAAQMALVDPRASAWLTTVLVKARLEGDEPLWTSQGGNENHHRELSDEWAAPQNDHKLRTSLGVWPPNHRAIDSRSWPDDDSSPAHVKELSTLWPPSHRASVSREWDTSHDRQQSYRDRVHFTNSSNSHSVSDSFSTYVHSVVESRRWDAQHNPAYSNLWMDTPNHTRMVSVQWDPAVHGAYESHRWPANHQPADSHLPRPVTPAHHEQSVSDEWGPDHITFGSVGWPPMHYLYITRTWIAHDRRYSLVWPPNHQGAVSLGWPDRILPGQWPANHLSTVSSAPGSSPPSLGPSDWPLFPDNHDWFTTIREIITIPADVVGPFVP